LFRCGCGADSGAGFWHIVSGHHPRRRNRGLVMWFFSSRVHFSQSVHTIIEEAFLIHHATVESLIGNVFRLSVGAKGCVQNFDVSRRAIAKLNIRESFPSVSRLYEANRLFKCRWRNTVWFIYDICNSQCAGAEGTPSNMLRILQISLYLYKLFISLNTRLTLNINTLHQETLWLDFSLGLSNSA
jgi:hypothetical protein